MLHKRIKILITLVLLAVVWGLFLYVYMLGERIEPYTKGISYYQYPKESPEMCGDFYCYSPQQFVDIYTRFESEMNLPVVSKYIFDNKPVDEYIQQIAETLGYRKRVFANEADLVRFENVLTRLEVRDAYIAMRNEMLERGIRLHFVSGYRDSIAQRSIFTRKLSVAEAELIPTGIYDEDIYRTLATSAIPAYSKHHSGYAVDFGCGNDYLVYSFAETECYAWMAENNFENAKRFGFIPSYPEGVEQQGPNPEPWEFVWVGVDNLK